MQGVSEGVPVGTQEIACCGATKTNFDRRRQKPIDRLFFNSREGGGKEVGHEIGNLISNQTTITRIRRPGIDWASAERYARAAGSSSMIGNWPSIDHSLLSPY